MFPLPLHIYFELAAAITALACLPALKHTKLIWFVPYLLFIVSVELLARFLYHELHQPNAWLYNLSVPVEYCFYLYMLSHIFTRKIFIIASLLFGSYFLLYWLYGLIFVTGFASFNQKLFVAGSTGCMLFSILSFIELYQSDNPRNIYLTPEFWIITGIFLFNSGEFVYDLFSEFAQQHMMQQSARAFMFINHSLINVLYSTYIISFLCQKIYGISKKA